MIFLIGMQTRMASLRIDERTYGLIKSALIVLPKRVGFRVLRKALSAWGGFVRNKAKALAPRQTGLLQRSLKVKTVIPDASYNPKHHGKPAYVLVGPSRNVTGAMQGGKLLSSAKAKKLTAAGETLKTRRASRYAHLVERGHKGGAQPHPFIRPAEEAGRVQGIAILSAKLEAGIQAEAAALAK